MASSETHSQLEAFQYLLGNLTIGDKFSCDLLLRDDALTPDEKVRSPQVVLFSHPQLLPLAWLAWELNDKIEDLSIWNSTTKSRSRTISEFAFHPSQTILDLSNALIMNVSLLPKLLDYCTSNAEDEGNLDEFSYAKVYILNVVCILQKLQSFELLQVESNFHIMKVRLSYSSCVSHHSFL